MAAISGPVRQFVRARIGDTTSGWNYWIGQVWNQIYGLPVKQVPQIDTVRPGSNFFQGQIAPQIIDANDSSEYPICLVYSVSAEDTHIVNPAEFGGIVRVGVEFWESFELDLIPPDVESSADAIEDAMYETFNSQQYYGLTAASGFVYNNEMNVTRGPLMVGGENYLRQSRYSLIFRSIQGNR